MKLSTVPRSLLLTSLLAVLPATQAMASSADEAFKKLYTSEWKWRESQQLVDDESSNSFSSSLPHVDEATQQAHLKYWQGVEAKLAKIDQSKLTYKDEVSYKVYKEQLDTMMTDIKFKVYQRPLSGDTSFWGDLTYVPQSDFHSEQDYRDYLKWLSSMPRYFDENIDNMRAGLKRGFTLPKVTLKGRDVTAQTVVDAKPKDNPFFAPFTHYPAHMPKSVQDELTKEGLAAMAKYVIPAHEHVLTFLRKEYIPGAVTSIAAYDLPNGKAFYQSQIKEYSTLDMTPTQIHNIGLEEVAKIHKRMLKVMHQVHFKGDLHQFFHFLRTDPQFYAKTPQELLNHAAWIAKEFDGVADKWFGRLPRRRFAIVPVPPDIAPFYTGGRGGPGIYLVNTYDLPSRPLYSLPALTMHESAPGHAFQMPLAQENKDLPVFRRNYFISGYGEGWAVYCESLGEEMGIYHTPYEVFGMLNYQMWRAARLVVDTGIHAQGWSRKQAQDYLLQNTSLSKHEITTEVDRYIAWPGQAVSYYLGEMAIKKDRARAEKALGRKFDIRHFHDTVLQMGSVPLDVLSARIDKFIKDGGPSPYKD
ncbi:DUF885 domain-containing protein [Gallaecimonas mangrovi]|uniref:DUF885 domain-containing protein n=1 Tax=Gallaecimonas mangrovi TaxID=2291597 RepID=UPI000E203C6A|nr:DUF885 family protein [Gallaecimonas mangrovi]